MINKILEMDKKARDMQAQAEENKHKRQSEIEDRKRELYQQYAESLKEIVEMTQAEQKEKLKTGKQALDAQAEKVLAAMQQKYEAESETWIAHILQETVGHA